MTFIFYIERYSIAKQSNLLFHIQYKAGPKKKPKLPFVDSTFIINSPKHDYAPNTRGKIQEMLVKFGINDR